MDVLQQAERDQGGEHRGAAVRHQRQRYAGHGHDPETHADVLERLEAEPAGDPSSGKPSEQVGSLCWAIGPPRHSSDAEQQDDQLRAKQAKLLTDDRGR